MMDSIELKEDPSPMGLTDEELEFLEKVLGEEKMAEFMSNMNNAGTSSNLLHILRSLRAQRQYFQPGLSIDQYGTFIPRSTSISHTFLTYRRGE
jgi:hypothetical protein